MIKRYYPCICLLLSIALLTACQKQTEVEKEKVETIPFTTKEENPRNLRLSIDFGEINDFKIYSKTYLLKNELTEPVELKELNSSCGCLSTEMPSSLPAGSTAYLTIHFNPVGYQGEVKQSMKIETQPGEYSSLLIYTKANVQPLLDYNPKIITFPKQAVEDLSKNVVVKLNKLKTFTIKEINNPEGYNVSLQKGDTIPIDSVITITKLANQAERITSDKDSKQEKEITITGESDVDISISLIETDANYFSLEPSAINIVVPKPELSYSNEFTIVPLFDNFDPEFITCTSDNPALQFETLEPLTLNDDGSIASPQKMKVSLSADKISSSTRIPFHITYRDYKQKSLIWVTLFQ